MSKTLKNEQSFTLGRRVLLGLTLVVIVAAVFFLLKLGKLEGEIRNVVLISIDTCRADSLSCYGCPHKTTPNIDRLAEESTVFTNVITPVPLTLPGHSSMLTGTNPPYHRVHDNINYQLGESNLTLAEILRQNGYTTGAIVSSFVMDSQFGLCQGFDTYNDRFERKSKAEPLNERKGDQASRFAIDWLEQHKNERFFLFLHYYDPHDPYNPPQPFATIFKENLYAGEVAYADHCVDKVIGKLKELRLYDSSLIIVTSDHGEMLGQHGEYTHGYFVYQGALKVPLIVELPGQSKPHRVNKLVGLIDIVPTICSLLGIEPPSPIHGKDLSGFFSKEAEIDEDERYLYCESFTPMEYGCSALLGVVGDRWKYIQTPRPELYDLSKDPDENENLADKDRKRAQLLQSHLKLILHEQVRTASSDSKLVLDEESRKRLESLGYIAGAASVNFEFDQSKKDPKDFIDFHTNCHGQIDHLISQGRYAEAKSLAEEIITQQPDFLEGYVKMAEIATRQNDYAAALPYLYQALRIKPDYSKVNHNLGVVLSELGRSDEAVNHFRSALRVRPDYAEARTNLAITLSRQGKLSQAVTHFRRALKLIPDDVDVHYGLGLALSKQGKLNEAISHFRAVLQVEPDNLDTHYNLGIALSRQGKLDEAIKHYRRCLRINPQDNQARQALEAILTGKGR